MKKDNFTIGTMYNDILCALNECRLYDALALLQGVSTYLQQGLWIEKVERIKQAYDMLVDCLSKGMDDPERKVQYARFLREAYEVADLVLREKILNDASLHYSMVWHTLCKMPHSGLTMAEAIGFKASYRHLFDVAWTSAPWLNADYEAACAYIDETPEGVVCGVLGGVTIGLLEVFDVRRLLLLLHATKSKSSKVRVRATIGVAMASVIHANRLTLYPETTDKIDEWRELRGMTELLQTIQMQLMLTQATGDSERRLREEIMPEIVERAKRYKLSSKDEKTGETSQRSDEHQLWTGDELQHPMWSADADEDRLAKKMRELADMQAKGVDVFMGSFKLLKQRFAFFDVAANWFLPFSSEAHPDVEHVLSEFPFVSNVLSNGALCDSDKYSFCFFLKELPAAQHTMLREQMGGVWGDRADAQAMLSHKGEVDVAYEVRGYLQDLYRFYHLFRWKCTSSNPFKVELLLLTVHPLGRLLSSPTTLRSLAHFAFGEKNYNYALSLYKQLPEDAEILERCGFCSQMMGDFVDAITFYEKANLLREETKWGLRQLAFCYRKTGNHLAASSCYERLETLEPDNVNVLLQLGECYMLNKNYDGAFSKLHKADYLSPQVGRAVKALAWCSLLTGKLDQAKIYYAKILQHSPTAEDYFNAAHVDWLLGNIPLSMERYCTSLKMDGATVPPTDFFAADAKVLIQNGLSPTDLHIMLDAVGKHLRL